MPEFKPFAGDHAIRSMTFGVELVPPVSNAELLQIRERIRLRWQDELPRFLPTNSITLNFGQSLGPPQPYLSQGGPFVLDRLKPSGEEEIGLHVANESMAVSCTSYSRWSEMWSKARGYIGSVVAEIASSHSVTAAALVYVDRFIWDGDPQSADASTILRRESKFITSRVQSEIGQWHCYQGFFEADTRPVDYSELINVNLDKKIEGRSCIFDITTSHRLALRESLPVRDMFAGQQTVLDDVMDLMHGKNKRMLSEILNDDTCARISLQGRKDNV